MESVGRLHAQALLGAAGHLVLHIERDRAWRVTRTLAAAAGRAWWGSAQHPHQHRQWPRLSGRRRIELPGHPWVSCSYSLQVRQWQEATEADETAAPALSLVDSAPLTRSQSERDRSWRKRRLVVHGGCDVSGYTDSDSDSDSASECDSDSDGTSGSSSSGGSDGDDSSRGAPGGCAGGNSVLAALLAESARRTAARMGRVRRRTV